MEKNYSFVYRKGDFNLELSGDKKYIEEYVNKFIKNETITNAKEKIEKGTSKNIREMSEGEFIRLYNFKKHTDIVLAFGYFLEMHGGNESFTPADINTCYYNAKMETSNSSQMIIQNIKRGFFMEAKHDGKEKRYRLTQSGVGYIQAKTENNSDKNSKS